MLMPFISDFSTIYLPISRHLVNKSQIREKSTFSSQLPLERELHRFDKKKHVQRTQEVRTWSEAASFSSKHRSHWNARKPREKRRINTANNHLGKLQVFDIVESLAPFRGQTCQQRIPFLESSSSLRWIPGAGNMMNYILGLSLQVQ